MVYFPTLTPSSFLPRVSFLNVFLREKTHMENIFHLSPWEAMKPVWGLSIFKFLWRVILGIGWAETKLFSAHSQIPLWLEKCVTEWNGTSCKVFLRAILDRFAGTNFVTNIINTVCNEIFDPITNFHNINCFTNQ